MRKLPTVERSCCVPAGGSSGPEEGAGGLDAAELVVVAQLFRAVGDPTRLAILRQLRTQEEVCACDFVACCDVAQPTVSHHLKVLREAGLISADKRGIWMYYRLNAPALDQLRRFVP